MDIVKSIPDLHSGGLVIILNIRFIYSQY